MNKKRALFGNMRAGLHIFLKKGYQKKSIANYMMWDSRLCKDRGKDKAIQLATNPIPPPNGSHKEEKWREPSATFDGVTCNSEGLLFYCQMRFRGAVPGWEPPSHDINNQRTSERNGLKIVGRKKAAELGMLGLPKRRSRWERSHHSPSQVPFTDPCLPPSVFNIQSEPLISGIRSLP